MALLRWEVVNGPGPLRGHGEISFWFHLESQSKNKKGRLRHCTAAHRMYLHGLVKETAVGLPPGNPTTLHLLQKLTENASHTPLTSAPSSESTHASSTAHSPQ